MSTKSPSSKIFLASGDWKITLKNPPISNNDSRGDSVYIVLSSKTERISLFIEDFETKSVKTESFNYEWNVGCPTTINKLATSIDDSFQIAIST